MLSNPNSTVWLTAVLTSVPTVQQHQRSSAALQESTQTLKGLCCCQVDLIQQDPVAFLHCLSQCSLQRKEGYTAIKLRSYTPVHSLFCRNTKTDSLYLTIGYQGAPWQDIFKLFTSTKAKTMAVSQARICCWVWLSLTASASHRSCSKAARQAHRKY